jgi:ankyrin repeat protein
VAVTRRGGRDGRAGNRSPESLAFITAVLAAGANSNAQLAFHEPSRGGRDNRFADDLLTTGATPLLRAAQTFDNEVVRLLLAHGARVDLPNASGVTPFMAAAGIGTRGGGAGVLGPGTPDNVVSLSLETMEILRQAGADVNARITDVTSLTGRIARDNSMRPPGDPITGKQGQTALFQAAETGRADVVRYLLQHGARTDVRDDAGRTPGAVARSKEIAALLPPAGGISR